MVWAKHNSGLDSAGGNRDGTMEGRHEIFEVVKERNFWCVMKERGSESCV